MNPILRSGLAFAALLVLARWLVPLGSLAWAYWFLNEHIYSSRFLWLSWANLVSWLYYAIAFLAFGFALGLLAPVRNLRWLALVFGAAYSLDWFSRSHYHFYETASVGNYFWAFSELLVPPIAAMVGGHLCQRLETRKLASSNGAQVRTPH